MVVLRVRVTAVVDAGHRKLPDDENACYQDLLLLKVTRRSGQGQLGTFPQDKWQIRGSGRAIVRHRGHTRDGIIERMTATM
ncbi:hypothetical protein GCM10009675_43430 [Prauserella alba]|uniref:Uncharacterized protein n=1 Tax=Prauserella alba TaxID=176898 RepID=A0ABN1VLZ3_9PSEU